MQTSYDPQNNSLYVPFHDQCLSMTADVESPTGYGPRAGIMRPGSDPNKYMNIGKIDVATGEMKVIYSQPQGTNGSALTTAGGLVFFGDLNRRVRALDADDGKVLWESVVGGMVMTSTDHLCGERQAICDDVHRRRPVADHRPAPRHRQTDAPRRRRASGIYVFALP